MFQLGSDLTMNGDISQLTIYSSNLAELKAQRNNESKVKYRVKSTNESFLVSAKKQIDFRSSNQRNSTWSWKWVKKNRNFSLNCRTFLWASHLRRFELCWPWRVPSVQFRWAEAFSLHWDRLEFIVFVFLRKERSPRRENFGFVEKFIFAERNFFGLFLVHSEGTTIFPFRTTIERGENRRPNDEENSTKCSTKLFVSIESFSRLRFLSLKLLFDLETIELKFEVGLGFVTKAVFAMCLSDLTVEAHDWSSDVKQREPFPRERQFSVRLSSIRCVSLRRWALKRRFTMKTFSPGNRWSNHWSTRNRADWVPGISVVRWCR